MKTVAVLLTLFFTHTAYAQRNNTSSKTFFENWTLGIKGGGNVSGLLGDLGDDDQVFYANFHVGGVANKTINEAWTAALEPHISVVGRRTSDGFERITYFNIPVLAKYQLPNNFTIDGGLHIGIKLAELREVDDSERQRINRFKRIAPGLTLGTTYSINKNWFTQFRLNYKFSDIIRDEGNDTEGSSFLVFQVSFGYLFGK